MFEPTKERLQRSQLAGERDNGHINGPEELDAMGVREAEPGDEASKRMDERHSMLMEALKDERDRQGENRWQMARDEDYYDNLQWDPDDAQLLIDRGQAPLVFNKIRPTIEWVAGTEKRTRVDFKILPREQSDEQNAEVKTKVLKYLSDVNRTQFHRSSAFHECIVAGLGWLEDGINTDPEAELIFSGHESWRNMYFDSRSREFDLADARYLFRSKVVDLDVARAMFPHAATHLDGVAHTDDRYTVQTDDDDVWYLGERLTNAVESEARMRFGERSAFVASSSIDAGRREVIRLIEAWYRVPEAIEFFANGPFQGKPFNKVDPAHHEAKKQGATTFHHVAMRMRAMIATEQAPLWDGASWYRHNKFPFTPLWAYRRKRDGMPYGMVRGIRDIQDDFNKRRSKALHVLSTTRVIADRNAVDDPEMLRQEASRPDAVILKKPGTELVFDKPTAELTGNLELMQLDEMLMQDVSGVTSELQGKETNATSGKAILARQEQGTMVTAGLFDNLRLGIQLQGEKQLSLAEQYKTAPQVIRLVGNRKPTEWLAINQVDPVTGQVVNDITARAADFIVSEQDYRANLQQAAFEAIGEKLSQIGTFAPQVVVNLLDLWMELADVPNKDEFVARIRAANGQLDPAQPLTPEQILEMQERKAKAKIAEDTQLQTMIAQLRKLEADAEKVGADTVGARITALLSAVEAGAAVVQAPPLAPVADEIARQAGWQPVPDGVDPNIPMPAMPAPLQPAMPAGVPMETEPAIAG